MGVPLSTYPTARDVTNLVRALVGDNQPQSLGVPLPVQNWNVTTSVLTINFSLPSGLIPGDAFQFHSLAFIVATSDDVTVTAAAGTFTGSGNVDQVFPIGLGTWAVDVVLLPLVNSALRKLGRALKAAGSTEFKEDNIFVTIPGLTFSEPSTQVFLTYEGLSISSDANPAPVFDVAIPTGVLPSNFLYAVKLQERQTGSQNRFVDMFDMTNNGGLPSENQGAMLRMWEGIEDGISFLGASQDNDIRIRAQMGVQPVVTGASSVFILDSTEQLANATAAMATQPRGTPEVAEGFKQDAEEAKEKLIAAVVRPQQAFARRMRPYRRGNRMRGGLWG